MLTQTILAVLQEHMAVMVILAKIKDCSVIVHAPGVILNRDRNLVPVLEETDTLKSVIKVKALQEVGIPR